MMIAGQTDSPETLPATLDMEHLAALRGLPPGPVAVVGGGSWALALSKLLAHNGGHVRFWVRNPDVAAHLRLHGTHPRYLPGMHLPVAQVQAHTALEATLEGAGWVLLAVPAAFVPDALADATPDMLAGKVVVSATKGMLLPSPANPMPQLITDYLQIEMGVPTHCLGVVAGPCHAEEVAQERLSYLTLCSPNAALAKGLARALETPHLKTRTSSDMEGAQYAAVLKNIYALMAGVAHGAGHGDNFLAMLVTAATREMQRFMQAMSPMFPEREVALAPYLGDLLVTAYSRHSRNRAFGTMVGQGYTTLMAQTELGMVAEGYYAARSIRMLARHVGVHLPIADAAYNILYGRASAALELHLLSRDLA